MISLQNVSKDLGEFHLQGVTMEIYDGEYFVFIGPTGAGKSILLETMAGIYAPDTGRIVMDGRDITSVPSRERNIGMVYQDYALFPYLSVDDNIAFGLKNLKMGKEDIRDKVEELKEFLGIAHLAHRYPGTLSGGEQQKVAMARAIAIEPKVLLLDEPLSALDSQTKSMLRDGLTKVNREYGITMVHVTHDQTEGIILADRIGVMMHGRLMQVGDSKEIFYRPVNEEMASFVGMENILHGTVIGNDEGIAEVRTGAGDRIFALTDIIGGAVKVYVRPEDILLSVDECDSSAQNHLRGAVTALQDLGPLVRVTLSTGIVSLVTKRSLHAMGFQEGMELHAAFKATSAHVAKD